jgi:hypothetical protein
VQSIKCIRFDYKSNPEIEALLDTFKDMCNTGIRIAIAEDATSKFDLISKAYHKLKEYDVHTHYILTACEVAFPIYRRWRDNAPLKAKEILTLPYFRKKGILNELVRARVRLPFVKTPFLKLDSLTYKLDYLLVRIPTRAHSYLFLTLDGSLYHRIFLADKSLNRGSMTITRYGVFVTFKKQAGEFEVAGHLGIDLNEKTSLGQILWEIPK